MFHTTTAALKGSSQVAVIVVMPPFHPFRGGAAVPPPPITAHHPSVSAGRSLFFLLSMAPRQLPHAEHRLILFSHCYFVSLKIHAIRILRHREH